MFCFSPIPILPRLPQQVGYRGVLLKLTAEVDILHLRTCQLTFQRSQLIHLLDEIADKPSRLDRCLILTQLSPQF